MSTARDPLPVLVLRSAIVLPRQVATFEVSREENVLALGRSRNALLAAIPVRKRRVGTSPENLSPVAVVCRLVARIELPGGGVRVTVEGLHRASVLAVERSRGSFAATLGPPLLDTAEPEAARIATERVLAAVAALDGGGRTEERELLALNSNDIWRLADLVRSTCDIEYRVELEVVEENDPIKRLEALAIAVERKRRTRSSEGRKGGEIEPAQRWRSVRADPGDADPHEREVRSLEERIAFAPLSRVVRHQALRELAHFRRLRPASSEAACIRNYLEWVLELPWDFGVEAPKVDFETVEEVLAESHTALRDVKDRVVEHLAVRLLAKRAHGTVLCFLGPPGTGKSSMGRAVAEALGREFVQIPGGTVTEEEQLRGQPHRQEGAMPGIVMQSLHRAGSTDAVILIDEIDKLELGGSGASGGALLDLLDPEQNAEFVDHYLGVPYDLSRCIFIVTANDRDDIAEAVLDRLEVIEFGGYTESEKLSIARDHLIGRARAMHGLEPTELRISPAALRAIVRSYTEEAGVRHLQRLLNSLARKAAVSVVRGGSGLYVHKGDLLSLLGPAVVDEEFKPRRSALGIATGLAWTSAGGTLLPVEALAMVGAGRTILTGMLGDVMRESVQTAISYVRTRFSSLKVQQDLLDTLDLHLHFPSGATPKDGPSAGVSIAAALISLVAKVPVRHDVAMTGEVSLHGNVLPVGGLKEKLLAAIRAGIPEVIVPERNRQEVLRLPAEIRDKLEIHMISHVQEAFDLVLAKPLRGRAQRNVSQRAGRRQRTARGAHDEKRARRGS